MSSLEKGLFMSPPHFWSGLFVLMLKHHKLFVNFGD